MKVRLFIKQNLEANKLVELPNHKSNYIKNVLRLKTGDKVFIFNSNQGEFEGLILEEKKTISIKILSLVKSSEFEGDTKINLVFANIKNNLVADILNSCTQIGIDEFTPIITKYTTNHNFSNTRSEKIIEEALEQSQRIKFPKLNDLSQFHDILNSISQDDLIIFADEKANFQNNTLINNLKYKKIFIFIGPEGGFSECERLALQNKHAKTISLGKFILRAETAAICASFLINFIAQSSL